VDASFKNEKMVMASDVPGLVTGYVPDAGNIPLAYCGSGVVTTAGGVRVVELDVSANRPAEQEMWSGMGRVESSTKMLEEEVAGLSTKVAKLLGSPSEDTEKRALESLCDEIERVFQENRSNYGLEKVTGKDGTPSTTTGETTTTTWTTGESTTTTTTIGAGAIVGVAHLGSGPVNTGPVSISTGDQRDDLPPPLDPLLALCDKVGIKDENVRKTLLAAGLAGVWESSNNDLRTAGVPPLKIHALKTGVEEELKKASRSPETKEPPVSSPNASVSVGEGAVVGVLSLGGGRTSCGYVSINNTRRNV
jgi:hypothetical protein